VVPFRDGTDPTHSTIVNVRTWCLLTLVLALSTYSPGWEVRQVNRLSVNHTRAYHTGYYGERGPASKTERRKRILQAIRGFQQL
jgi:MUG2-like C-terminal domain